MTLEFHFIPTPGMNNWQIQGEYLQLPCAVDELCVPAFIGADEMGEILDDIGTMFD